MKKFISLLLTLCMIVSISSTAVAVDTSTTSATPSTSVMMETGARSGGVITTKNRPAIPSGFYTTPYAVLESNLMLDFTSAVATSGITAYIFSPLTGTALIYYGAVAAAIAGLAVLGGDSLPAGAVEYIYEAEDPVSDFQVPYVYWHVIEYTVDTEDEGPVVFYDSYYEYAVMPRSISNEEIR